MSQNKQTVSKTKYKVHFSKDYHLNQHDQFAQFNQCDVSFQVKNARFVQHVQTYL